MGTLLRMGGLRVYLLAGDHLPPHVHIAGSGGEVCVLLTDGAVIGARKARAECREAIAWVRSNMGSLLEEWRRVNG